MISDSSTPAGRRRADDDCAAGVQRNFRPVPILDTELGPAARLDGACAVVAIDKGNCDVAIGGRTDDLLYFYVFTGDRANQTIGAGAKRAECRVRLERNLDVAREIAAVVDVAGWAVCSARQLVEPTAWLAGVGTKEDLPPATTTRGTGFEIWSLSAEANDRFVIPTQVVLVGDRLVQVT
jgi:hypothetical protein